MSRSHCRTSRTDKNNRTLDRERLSTVPFCLGADAAYPDGFHHGRTIIFTRSQRQPYPEHTTQRRKGPPRVASGSSQMSRAVTK